MLNVCIENNSSAYAQMFHDNGWNIVDSLEDADLLQLEGGADVSPSLYNEETHPTTYSSEAADDYTMSLYDEALRKRIPIAGICRGSQFLSVMGGGKLWQDIDGHATGYGHDLIDIKTGTIIEGCSSTHHQQHRPADNAIIIAESFPQLSNNKSNVKDGAIVDYELGTRANHNEVSHLMEDVEAFYYEHIKALGFQPHPEFFGVDHPCQMYYFDLIAKYLGLRAK